MKKYTNKGFVSIFVVIFTAVLISVVTIGFIRIMVIDQQQATTSDLSRSAYDSALAGVEDAKRALIQCAANPTAAGCDKLTSAVCNESVRLLQDVTDSTSTTSGEVSVRVGKENLLDQAYTCVKIQTITNDYLGKILQDSYKVIPLKTVDTGAFKKIKIEWFSANNLGSGSLVSLPTDPTQPLHSSNANTPPVLRAQVIQVLKSNIDLNSLNNKITNGTGSDTYFLYPLFSAIPSATTVVNTAPTRRATPTTIIDKPETVSCYQFDSSVYSCSATIDLPADVVASSHNAYLVLSAFYNNADYRVTLLSSTDAVVPFNGVQPEVDSTGRANDLFRRVKTRVEAADISFPYPEAAVDITGNLCKDFAVTDVYIPSTACTE